MQFGVYGSEACEQVQRTVSGKEPKKYTLPARQSKTALDALIIIAARVQSKVLVEQV